MRLFTYLFCLILLGSACKKVDPLGYRMYTIKEGNHRSTYQYTTNFDTLVRFKAIFDSSAIYNTTDPSNQYDVNKLYGVSDCGCSHMKYSIRFGWRWLNDSLEILLFKHQGGVFSFEKITSITLNDVHQYEIIKTDNEYVLYVDNVYRTTPRSCPGLYRSYFLYPYFGGDETAPHNITIQIKKQNQ